MLSLKTKLTIMIIGLIVTSHIATGALIIRQMTDAMHNENHRRGIAVALDLAHTSALSLVSQDLTELRNYVGLTMQQQYVAQAMVIDTQCRIIMHSDLSKVGTSYIEPCSQLSSPTFGKHYYLANEEQEVMDILVPIEIANVNLGSVIISYSHDGVKEEISTLKHKITLIVLIATCVAIICAILVGEYITRPLIHLSNAASKLGSGCFDIKRLGTAYTDEIGELARTFYEMVGRLEQEVCHDALTGLFTRNVFQIQLAEECALSLRHHQPLAVMMIDVDHFKSVNDTYGHLAGDKVLQEIAQILQELVRGEDCVARYGGEEFVLLMPQTPPEGAMLVAEKMRKKVEQSSFHLAGHGTISLTISIGVAFFPEDTEDIKSLIELADKALYTAKSRGRNQVSKVPIPGI